MSARYRMAWDFCFLYDEGQFTDVEITGYIRWNQHEEFYQWIDSPAATGEYTRTDQLFRFTDPDTAFAFKMKFG